MSFDALEIYGDNFLQEVNEQNIIESPSSNMHNLESMEIQLHHYHLLVHIQHQAIYNLIPSWKHDQNLYSINVGELD